MARSVGTVVLEDKQPRPVGVAPDEEVALQARKVGEREVYVVRHRYDGETTYAAEGFACVFGRHLREIFALPFLVDYLATAIDAVFVDDYAVSESRGGPLRDVFPNRPGWQVG